MEIIQAIKQRHANRAFLDQAVPRETVTAILDAARWAPSGVNIQPWQVAVVQGESQRALSEALIEARMSGEPANPDYQYYPSQWQEPYRSRRKACGLALYQALDIKREDSERQVKAWNNNYRFFGAPVGLFIFIDRKLGQGAWVDMGMFIQNLMLAALEYGLATCPQASLAEYPDLVRQRLGIDEGRALICGIALGYPDIEHPVNRYRLEREPVEGFTQWFD